MPEAITEVTHASWPSRLKGSFKGIVVGLLLVAVALVVLFKNEGRAVRRSRALAEGGREVVAVSAERVDPANEGRLVHVSGPATAGELVSDPELGVTAMAIHLDREVEMYQWRERSESSTETRAGGSTETRTTTSYERVWADRLIDSSRFKQPEGHQNPASMPLGSSRFSAQRVSLGAFRLSPSLVERIGPPTELPVRSLDGLPQPLAARARLANGGIYVGADPVAPQVGDLRIRFRQVEPQVVSVVARQSGATLGPFATRSGGTVELLRTGSASAEEMFTAAEESNRWLTRFLRLFGFLLMMFGFRLVLRPLRVAADVLPALGTLAQTGVNLLAFFVALPLALLTIAFAWLYYRPLLAALVLLLAVAAIFGLLKLLSRARTRAPAAAAG